LTPTPPTTANASSQPRSPRPPSSCPAPWTSSWTAAATPLRLPRRPTQAPRPLHHLDPQGRRQDHHPAPDPRTGRALPLVRSRPPTPTHHRARRTLATRLRARRRMGGRN